MLILTPGTGRAHEFMILLEKMIREGRIGKIPVYIDGMIWDITAIHTTYPEFLNHTVRKQIFHKDNNPFLSPIFRRVENPKERKEIIEKGSQQYPPPLLRQGEYPDSEKKNKTQKPEYSI